MAESSVNQEIVEIRGRSQFKEIRRRFMRNKPAVVSFFIILFLIFCALFPQLLTPYDYAKQNLREKFIFPCAEHLFGTDNLGRDIFTRVVYGCRTSLSIGISAVVISCFFGIIIGSVAGYCGTVADNILMRLMDILLAIPNILLAMSIVAAFGTGQQNLILAIGIGGIPGYARIVRASILSVKDQEFVEASRCIGGSPWRVVTHHILPNCLAPIIVQATMSIAGAILSTAGLSFIGLGIEPPLAEWGSMLSAGRSYLRDYWFVVTFPGVAIMITVFAFNLFGDGLRDALDPKLKR